MERKAGIAVHIRVLIVFCFDVQSQHSENWEQVVTVVDFALALRDKLDSINAECFNQFVLRVGELSHLVSLHKFIESKQVESWLYLDKRRESESTFPKPSVFPINNFPFSFFKESVKVLL